MRIAGRAAAGVLNAENGARESIRLDATTDEPLDGIASSITWAQGFLEIGGVAQVEQLPEILGFHGRGGEDLCAALRLRVAESKISGSAVMR